MSVLRRLSHELRQAVVLSGKHSLEPASVVASKKNSFRLDRTQKSHTANTNCYMDFVRRSIHTSNVNKDVEGGLKALGSGCAMIGAIGPGIGIGVLYGNLLTGIARNPSLKDQLFILALMGTAFCETVCLFCFVVSMIILFS